MNKKIKFINNFEEKLEKALNRDEVLNKNKYTSKFYNLVMNNKSLWAVCFGQSLGVENFDTEVDDLIGLQSWVINVFIDDALPLVKYYKIVYDNIDDLTDFNYTMTECDKNDEDIDNVRFFYGSEEESTSLAECMEALSIQLAANERDKKEDEKFYDELSCNI